MTDDAAPQISQQDGVTIISMSPAQKNLDEWGMEPLTSQLIDAIDQANPPRVILEMSNVDFFGSSFIEVMFRMWNRVNAEEGGRFCLCNLTAYCREVIDVARLDKLWKTYDSTDEAVAALNSSEW